MLTRRVLERLAFAWVVALIVLSLQPVRPEHIHDFGLRHVVLHLIVFAATAILLLALSRNHTEEWIAVAGVVCLAIGIETAQFLLYRLPGMEWRDVREDTIGVLLGLMVTRFTRVRSLLLAG